MASIDGKADDEMDELELKFNSAISSYDLLGVERGATTNVTCWIVFHTLMGPANLH